jgi:Tfp pilus assembly protein PilF
MAGEMCRKSNEISPGVATYMDTYAWVLYKQGKYAEARTEQEKAIAANGGDDGALLEHYGDILFKLGDSAGAQAQWQRAQVAGGASDLIDRKVSEGRLVE